PPLLAAIGVPGVPPHPRPRPAPVAFVRLEVREPAERRMGMRLVREQERPFVAAPAVVAIEKPGQAQRMDHPPESGARVIDLGLAGRDRPGAEVATCRRMAFKGTARAADQVGCKSPRIARGEGVGQRWLPGRKPKLPYKQLSVNAKTETLL